MTLIAAEKEQPIIRSLLFLAIAQISRGNGVINKKAKINEETGFTIKKPKLYIISMPFAKTLRIVPENKVYNQHKNNENRNVSYRNFHCQIFSFHLSFYFLVHYKL